MFGRKKKDYVFADQAILKGPATKLYIAKAAYSPSHAGAVAMDKDEQVVYVGPAGGTNSNDWTCIVNKAQQQGFVPSSFLDIRAGGPQLLQGQLRIAKTEFVFEATQRNAAMELKAP